LKKQAIKKRKAIKKQPLYDFEIIRGEMTAKGFTVERMVEKSGLRAPTVTRARMGYDVRISTLKQICNQLGLEVKIERAA
jgi:transcriptional regulator with XRE-family HTH domain